VVISVAFHSVVMGSVIFKLGIAPGTIVKEFNPTPVAYPNPQFDFRLRCGPIENEPLDLGYFLLDQLLVVLLEGADLNEFYLVFIDSDDMKEAVSRGATEDKETLVF